MSHNTTEADAKEFGLHVKQGGWRLGLLVARNVEKGAGEGGDPHRNDRYGAKVSAQQFGRDSSTSAPRILRYLAAWEKAAAAGHVPHAADLTPGEDVDLDVEALPSWNEFYTGAAGDFRIHSEERKQALIRQAEADGIGRGKVQEIAANNKAMAAAIKADPQTARAALEALNLARDTAEPEAPRPSDTADLDAKYAAAREREEADRKQHSDQRVLGADAHLHRAKRSIRSAMTEIEHVVLTDEDRGYLRDEIAKVVKLADLFTAHLDGDVTDWDAALASLVGGE